MWNKRDRLLFGFWVEVDDIWFRLGMVSFLNLACASLLLDLMLTAKCTKRRYEYTKMTLFINQLRLKVYSTFDKHWYWYSQFNKRRTTIHVWPRSLTVLDGQLGWIGDPQYSSAFQSLTCTIPWIPVDPITDIERSFHDTIYNKNAPTDYTALNTIAIYPWACHHCQYLTTFHVLVSIPGGSRDPTRHRQNQKSHVKVFKPNHFPPHQMGCPDPSGVLWWAEYHWSSCATSSSLLSLDSTALVGYTFWMKD